MDAAAEDTVVECIWGVDDQAPAEPRPISGFLPPILVTPYPITAVTLNATHLVVARASGIAQMFRLLPSGGVAAEGEVRRAVFFFFFESRYKEIMVKKKDLAYIMIKTFPIYIHFMSKTDHLAPEPCPHLPLV